MVLALAEDSAGVMRPSYEHAVVGEARSVESQRIVNYADLDGDGVNELFLGDTEEPQSRRDTSVVLCRSSVPLW
jgi:hypothetical protein